MANIEKDPISGQMTTGHEWDGIKELNTPLPRWWVWVFYVCIVWAVGYWVFYPSWPTLSGYAKGAWNYSSRAELKSELDAAKAAQQKLFLADLEKAGEKDIIGNPKLLRAAMAGGKVVFNENCAGCHGFGGVGQPGYPALGDDEWLWGGTLEDIKQTITYGIRSGHPEARVSEMPKFGVDGALKAEEIGAVADYVVGLSAGKPVAGAGATIFADNCMACHGEKGEGNRGLGGPPLNNAIWLNGGTKEIITKQVNNPRHGVMPAWAERLSPTTIKMLTVYVHKLGGGEN
jgi:cytochrome c oxidase cbb3-type subunit 3